jgi:hypothetical protein
MNRSSIASAAVARGVRLSALALAAAVLSWPAAAAESQSSTGRQTLQHDLAHCMTLAPGARANCRREAGAAAQARTQSRMPDASPDDAARYARNAVERCKPLPASDRADCEARMRGQGTVSGSVAGGGLLRELVTRDVALPTPVVPTAPPPR